MQKGPTIYFIKGKSLSQDINNGGFANLMEYFLEGSGSPFRLCKVRAWEKIIAIGMKNSFYDCFDWNFPSMK